MKQDQIVIYQSKDGQTQIDVRLENENNVHFLHVAESKTEEKDVMVKVVVNLINQRNE